MTFATISMLAIALGIDAFSVAVVIGAANHRRPWWPPVLRLSLAFGFFQFMMALLGWLAGSTVAERVAFFDHWVAFGLLALIGGKMIWEGWKKEEPKSQADQTKGLPLLMLSVATSIDALAVGFSFSVIQSPIFFAAIIIGVVCFFMTAMGVVFGKALARIIGRKVSILGGLVLVAIGVKILMEHS